MPTRWQERLPSELWFKRYEILTSDIEEWLLPAIRRYRGLWGWAYQFVPWFESGSGRRYKVIRITRLPKGRPARVLVLDRNLQMAPRAEAQAALHTLELAGAIAEGYDTNQFAMYVPENLKVSNLFIDALTRYRQALEGHPQGQRFLGPLERGIEFFIGLRDNNEEANRMMVEGCRRARAFQERFRSQGTEAVVYPGEPEAVFEPMMRLAEIRWHYAHNLKQQYLGTWRQLTNLSIKVRLARECGLSQQDVYLLTEATDTIEAVIFSFNLFHLAKTPREVVLGDIEQFIAAEMRTLATPQ